MVYDLVDKGRDEIDSSHMIIGNGVKIDVCVPFREEDESCGREKASKCGDVETICMMHRQDIENHVHAAGCIPYRKLFFFIHESDEAT